MKTTKLSAGIIALLTLSGVIFSSCGKDEDKPTPVQTPQELILGRWKTTYEGEDNNGNNIWDPSEKGMVESDDQVIVTFKNDGTYSTVG